MRSIFVIFILTFCKLADGQLERVIPAKWNTMYEQKSGKNNSLTIFRFEVENRNLKLVINEKSAVHLDFAAPKLGRHTYKLYFIYDSYLGADQEFDVQFKVEEQNSIPNLNLFDLMVRIVVRPNSFKIKYSLF
ncbi:unnamed protein product [Caenorhabditis sp. 36 PRJEB53466]|nr:unnamed protein product [Caenorhabditis sp. 36 PRJEB53466]